MANLKTYQSPPAWHWLDITTTFIRRAGTGKQAVCMHNIVGIKELTDDEFIPKSIVTTTHTRFWWH